MRGRVWCGFAGLCIVSGSRWLLGETLGSGPLGPLVRICLHDLALLIVLGGMAAVRRNRGEPPRSRGLWRIALYGLALFTAPALVLAGAGGRVTGSSETLVFLLVPVVVVLAVAQGQTGFGAESHKGDARGLLAPALAGVGGAGLLVPFTLPGGAGGWIWLGALVVCGVGAGLAAVRLHRLLRGHLVMAAAMVVAAAGALASGALAGSGWREIRLLDGNGWMVEGLAALVDGVVLVLSVWLLREMAPVRFAARYVVILLVSIGESYALMRPRLNGYEAAGAALMVWGAVMLLVRGSAGEGRADFAGTAEAKEL